ncbi:hypothetical protein M0811_08579 [Anaeramoeba ignava]|uniref:Ubiquitin-like domain-containing protein n=1 Tax=Anaeramoeba ignava TaxID=1746090 RepID=A0A9Q0LII6_ANAIG|nr:hypothetical protein M0811_08579 [Anaeramoeba ignava]
MDINQMVQILKYQKLTKQNETTTLENNKRIKEYGITDGSILNVVLAQNNKNRNFGDETFPLIEKDSGCCGCCIIL